MLKRSSRVMMIKTKNFLLALPGTVIGLFVAAIFFNEYLIIEIMAKPEQVNSYYFGSEVMIEHGGRKYSSSSAYSFSCLVLGVIGFIGSVIAQIISFLSNKSPVFIAYVINLTSIAIVFMLSVLI
ncbi:hypothetical protein NX722_02825 [Endozoicomonas gorgoniicola]|uniref:Uncharacterized protein n=1 Tax=Endozoicomonas gorgoniicola TaxID=1234144 RepID=A0ABT3MQF1_9GAMM|nr:hypothetical protein [Endozoicomonas gorgoniicola]MCW7551595.1 hypothetical protein [Endozoicomonas gorgoniicola]